MNLLKLAILCGVAAISIGVASPVKASWYTYHGGFGGGWQGSGWGSSGWGSSGLGWSSHVSTTTSMSNGSTGTTSTSSSSNSTPIPEPSNIIMLALGVAGLVAGRFAARSKRAKRDKL